MYCHWKKHYFYIGKIVAKSTAVVRTKRNNTTLKARIMRVEGVGATFGVVPRTEAPNIDEHCSEGIRGGDSSSKPTEGDAEWETVKVKSNSNWTDLLLGNWIGAEAESLLWKVIVQIPVEATLLSSYRDAHLYCKLSNSP